MTRALILALAAALGAGCASAPVSPSAGCQVASVSSSNVVSYGRQRPQSEMDRRLATADLARLGYRQEHMNDQPSATEEALRNCP